jgi:hypothetical protein
MQLGLLIGLDINASNEKAKYKEDINILESTKSDWAT